MNYYVAATIKVLEGGPLDCSDELSFTHEPVNAPDQWNALRESLWADGERLADLIEQLPDSILNEPFVDPKYGTYFRCLVGPIEHCHYHLGQIAQIRSISAKRFLNVLLRSNRRWRCLPEASFVA